MAFPVLEVVAARSGPAPGQRIALGDRLRIGRAREAELSLQTPHVSRFHCGVFHELGRWWVRDLGSANGIRVDGERTLEVELRHGTLIEVGRGYLYEFLAHERGAEPVDLAMEAAIREKPDDAQRWSVYTDWLEEQGVALGAVKLLGPFAGDLARSELHVVWAHGLPRRLTMRALNGDMHDWTWEHRLACLKRAPGLRFVRELELDLASCLRGDIIGEPPIQRVVEAIGDSLPMLERLIISPARVFGLGKLSERYDVQLKPWREATVTLTELRPLCAMTIEFFGAGREPREVKLAVPTPVFIQSRFVVTGATRASFSINAAGDLWEFMRSPNDTPGLSTLNGVAISRAFIRSGDVIEIVPGVTLTFSA